MFHLTTRRLVLPVLALTLTSLAAAAVWRSDAGPHTAEGADPSLGCAGHGENATTAASFMTADSNAAGSRLIQIALCLDTSGSMDGLIESAKQKLWAIVNDLATAEPTPKLEVALLTFGNDGHLAENGWVHLDSELTTDLDRISDRLFALTTNGGEEYVARVLRRTGTLGWDSSERTLRIAVVAGNESANQDPAFRYEEICAQLAEKDIVVNSIYCGPAEDEIALAWRHVSMLAGGTFANIDQDEGLVVVETPFDLKLAELSQRLNDTYIPIGSSGKAGAENQKRQDSNAATLGAAAQAARGCTKASKLYSCSWDLIDAVREGRVDLAKVEDAELPEEMHSLSKKERVKFVAEKQTTRETLQKEISDLGKQRDRYIREEIERAGLDASLSFDNVLRTAIRSQAEARGFTFEDLDDASSSPTDHADTSKAPSGTTLAASESPSLGLTGAADFLTTSQTTSLSSNSLLSKTPANTTAPLFQQARIASQLPPRALLVHLDPKRNDVEVAAFNALVDRADQLRAGNSGDVRTIDGAPRVPDAVVLLTEKSDWDLLTRVLSANAALQATPEVDLWLRIGGRSYLVQRGGC